MLLHKLNLKRRPWLPVSLPQTSHLWYRYQRKYKTLIWNEVNSGTKLLRRWAFIPAKIHLMFMMSLRSNQFLNNIFVINRNAANFQVKKLIACVWTYIYKLYPSLHSVSQWAWCVVVSGGVLKNVQWPVITFSKWLHLNVISRKEDIDKIWVILSIIFIKYSLIYYSRNAIPTWSVS